MRRTHGCRPAKPDERSVRFDYVALHQARAALHKRRPLSGLWRRKMKHIAELISNWRRYRQSIRELSRLTDRELADLGISRHEIPVVVRRSLDFA